MDELTACALLHVFTSETYVIKRIPHQTEIPVDTDFVIDIGRQYDPSKGLFDHHQWEHGKSSAGLIWEYLRVSEQYPYISKIIELIDQHDVGIRKATSFELPTLISSFNTDDIYDDDKQSIAFNQALQVLITYFTSLKNYQDKINAAPTIINNSPIIDSVIILPEYIAGWQTYINGTTELAHIRAVIWPKGDESTHWYAQVPTIEPGSYEMAHPRFQLDDSMIFVHANGFLCVAPDYTTMLNYLEIKNA
jgi:uncharacterized UPF0160 family protein